MKKALVFFGFLLACGAAQAQIKCWNDANGKRVCGDTPPAGARTTTIKGTVPAEPSPAAASKGAGKKGPLTPAEQEQEYKKRQIEASKAAEKSAQAEKDASAKKENCDRARESVRNLGSGQRMTRIDEKGERVFLEEEQIQQELAKARQQEKDWCN